MVAMARPLQREGQHRRRHAAAAGGDDRLGQVDARLGKGRADRVGCAVERGRIEIALQGQVAPDAGGGGNRYAPVTQVVEPAFRLPFRRAIGPDPEELDVNPRARSALLRVAVRTDAAAGEVDARSLAMPHLPGAA